VTGSADGIGRQIARDLIAGGHRVLLHARDGDRAAVASAGAPGAAGVVVGDLTSLAEIRALAAATTGFAPFDAVVHNAGVLESGRRERPVTADGLERTFSVNVAAPYLLTALMPVPARLVYLSTEMHRSGRPDLDDPQWERRRYDGDRAYSDSKLMVTALAVALAGMHPRTRSNAVNPGWVRSRMGGPGAPVSLAAGAETPVRLAVGDEPATGSYFTGGRIQPAHRLATDPGFQAAVLALCEKVTGTALSA